MRLSRACLLVLSTDSGLPSEFRIFAAGVNPTTKGKVTFDAQSAESVMAAYRTHGVDLMIDLEHESLDPPIRPDSRDARGWFGLEVRDGELWAVNVRWAPDGVRRLNEKTQRFISPAFRRDAEGRVIEIVNAALCAMPATDHAPALIAASRTETLSMDPKLIKEALDALIAGDANKCSEILKNMVASAAGASGEPAPADPLSDTGGEPPPAGDKPEDEVAATVQAATRAIATQSAEIVALKATVAKLESERASGESVERNRLVGELVKLGAETPATAWSDADRKVPVARLASEPLADLKARVTALGALPRARALETPTTPAVDVSRLSQREIEAASRKGMTPEQYAARKAAAVRSN